MGTGQNNITGEKKDGKLGRLCYIRTNVVHTYM